MRHILVKLLGNLAGAIIVILVVSSIGNVLFLWLPWQVSFQEQADTIQQFDLFATIHDIFPSLIPESSMYTKIVPELDISAALTNSILLATMTTTFFAMMSLVFVVILGYGVYDLLFQGGSALGSILMQAIASLLIIVIGPLYIWFTLLFGGVNNGYTITWIICGLCAISAGYTAAYYGIRAAQWISTLFLDVLTSSKPMRSAFTWSVLALIVLVLLVSMLMYFGQTEGIDLMKNGSPYPYPYP